MIQEPVEACLPHSLIHEDLIPFLWQFDANGLKSFDQSFALLKALKRDRIWNRQFKLKVEYSNLNVIITLIWTGTKFESTPTMAPFDYSEVPYHI